MARLLFTVWPYPTHLHPFIAVAQAVRARGHEVAFYTGGDAPSVLESAGFRCFPFRAVNWARVARTVDDLIAGRQRPSQLQRLWPRFLVDTVPAQVSDLDDVLRGWQPDALVSDIALSAPILILRERNRIPVAALSHVAHCILPGPDGPAQFAGVTGLAARLVTAGTRRRANTLRRQFGLSPLKVGVNSYTGTLPLYLVPGAPELDRRRSDLPPSVRYVGPCLWDKPPDQPPPAWLADIPRDRPIVVVDEGALFTYEPRILQLAARGLAAQPLTVLLIAGKGRDPGRVIVSPAAANVILHAHAPLSDLLSHASALVTNGNSESVLAALERGIPTVVLPSIWDQAEMALRVQETGVGLRVSPWWATPRSLRRAVDRVLNEPEFRASARQMGTALARCGGPRRAAEYLEELVAPKSPASPALAPSPAAENR